MTRTKLLLGSLALAAPLVLGGSIASAQRDTSPETHARTREQRDNVLARAQLVWKTGVVLGFIYDGAWARGVVLTDGTTVYLRRNSRALFRNVRPGSVVRVRGYVRPSGGRHIVREGTVVALRSARSLRNAAYTRPSAPIPSPAVQPAPVEMRSTVRAMARSANGRAQLLILANGATITLPDSIARALAPRGVHVGEPIVAHVLIAERDPGSRLLAQSIAFSDGSSFRDVDRR